MAHKALKNQNLDTDFAEWTDFHEPFLGKSA